MAAAGNFKERLYKSIQHKTNTTRPNVYHTHTSILITEPVPNTHTFLLSIMNLRS